MPGITNDRSTPIIGWKGIFGWKFSCIFWIPFDWTRPACDVDARFYRYLHAHSSFFVRRIAQVWYINITFLKEVVHLIIEHKGIEGKRLCHILISTKRTQLQHYIRIRSSGPFCIEVFSLVERNPLRCFVDGKYFSNDSVITFPAHP